MSVLMGLENELGEAVVEGDCPHCAGSYVVEWRGTEGWCTNCVPALVARAKEASRYGGVALTASLDRSVYEHALAIGLLE